MIFLHFRSRGQVRFVVTGNEINLLLLPFLKFYKWSELLLKALLLEMHILGRCDFSKLVFGMFLLHTVRMDPVSIADLFFSHAICVA